MDQVSNLELLLANFEVQHVVGEIDDDAYQREINLMAASLDSAKNELGLIKQAMDQLYPETVSEVAPIPEQVNASSITEVPVVNEIAADIPTESIPVISATAEATQEVAPKRAFRQKLAQLKQQVRVQQFHLNPKWKLLLSLKNPK